MHGGFTTIIPVQRPPLPRSVRHEIHEGIRRGYTLLGVEQRGGAWHLRFSGLLATTSIIIDPDRIEDDAA